MKINQIVRDIYIEYYNNAKLQKKFFDNIFPQLALKNNFLYESRIKSEESFALKIETGRDAFEDFFACRFIVTRKNDIFKFKDDLIKIYNIEILESRPEELNKIKQFPQDFSFNELRLYVKYKQPSNTITKEFLEQPFEIQIMTLYSYVWSKTTHDLVYKGSDISWGKSRIAYQIKALLEQAQYAIDTIEKTDEAYFPKHNLYETQRNIIEYLNKTWGQDLLPNDLNRLSSNISKLLEILNSNIKDLQKVVKLQIDTDNGNVPKNITPYQYIIKAYINNKPELISNLSKRTNNKKNIFQIAIVEDLDIDESIINDLKKKKILKDYRNYKTD